MPVFVTKTEIANMALSHVGAASVASFTEDSEQARQVRTWYDYTRRQVLEAYDWNFARRRVQAALDDDTISETGTDPMAGVWGYRYQYPADCVKVRKIQSASSPPGDAIPFDVETSLDGTRRTVLTNMEDAVLVYTRDQESTDTFDALFVLALSHLLAFHMAYALTGKRELRKQQVELYQMTVNRAAAANANERVDPPPREAEWIRGRA